MAEFRQSDYSRPNGRMNWPALLRFMETHDKVEVVGPFGVNTAYIYSHRLREQGLMVKSFSFRPADVSDKYHNPREVSGGYLVIFGGAFEGRELPTDPPGDEREAVGDEPGLEALSRPAHLQLVGANWDDAMRLAESGELGLENENA